MSEELRAIDGELFLARCKVDEAELRARFLRPERPEDLDAFDAWEEACQAVDVECGLQAARERLWAAQDALREYRSREV